MDITQVNNDSKIHNIYYDVVHDLLVCMIITGDGEGVRGGDNVTQSSGPNPNTASTSNQAVPLPCLSFFVPPVDLRPRPPRTLMISGQSLFRTSYQDNVPRFVYLSSSDVSCR